jgi:hypothetical protein
VKLRYTGTSHRDGKIVHGLKVESRVLYTHYSKNFMTQVYFDDALASITTSALE